MVIRGALDQPSQRRCKRGQVINAGERAQAIVADLGVGRHALRLPNYAGDLARTERGEDDAAGHDVVLAVDAVIERAERGVEEEDTGAAHRLGSIAKQARKGTKVIETARLVIRPATRADAAFMLAMLNDPGFVLNIGDRGVRTIADAEAYIEDRLIASGRQHGFAMEIVEAKGGGPVGLCGFVRRDGLDAPDLGFAFLERYCRHGYGLEAGTAMLAYGREVLRLDPILAITAPANLASQALLGRLGFVCEGVVRLPAHGGESALFRA